MQRTVLSVVLGFSYFCAGAQTAPPAACPVTPVKFSPDGVSVRIENISGKTIVGMTWFATISDATEHWNWVYWNVPGPSRLREFNWNKEIKPAARKTLSWYADLDYTHASGGALILGSVLFSDGSRWQRNPVQHECQAVWLNKEKHSFARPEELPPI